MRFSSMSNINNCLNYTSCQNYTNCSLNYINCTENTSEDDTGGTPLVWTAIQVVVFSVIILTALTGNILVCVAVCKFRQLQTTTNYAIVSLAITDVLMVYVMILHATMVIEGKWTLGVTICDVTSTIGLTLNLVSLLHLTYISLDRYIAIVKPFRYQVWLTKPRVIVMMILLWLFTCLVLNLPWADFEYRSNVFGCIKNVQRGSFRLSTLLMLLAFVSLPTLFILFTHVSIFRIARGHAIKLTKQKSHLHRTFHERSLHKDHSNRKKITATGFKRELKSVKTFGIVVGCFLICYIPFYTVATTRSFKGLDSIPEVVLTIVTWFAFVNSCMNPILYSLRHHQFKGAFKKIFRQGMGKILPLQADSNRHNSRLVRQTSGLDELSSGTRDQTFTLNAWGKI